MKDNEKEIEEKVNAQQDAELQAENAENEEQTTTDSAAENDADGGGLQAEVEKLKSDIDDLKEKNLRMMAEFENYRRRTAREKMELREVASSDLMRDMLPLIDDFERGLEALKNSEDVNALREGVELIYQKFVGFLSAHGVEAIDTADKDFNTEEHEAVTLFAAGEDKKGKVIDCMQKGYKMGDKVIRYAKVVVGE